eukprot:gb/GEZN01002395.1/.p1 GENE.gb/GEZN01002395.1/~~gb/GEZN01002395.1/.p1  ORF type:complete len:697 (-),score=45.66 gb/GEZN01002395.1/:359-2449(-)
MLFIAILAWMGRGAAGHSRRQLTQTGDFAPTSALPVTLRGSTATDINSVAIATNPAGKWVAIWPYSSKKGSAYKYTDSKIAVSSDQGSTWSTSDLGLNETEIKEFALSWDTIQSSWLLVWTDPSPTAIGILAKNMMCMQSADLITASPVLLSSPHGALKVDINTDSIGQSVIVWTTGNTGTQLFAMSCQGCSCSNASLVGPKCVQAGCSNMNSGAIAPRIVTDSKGLWVAVWSSEDDLSNTIGNDLDIVYALSTNNGISWSSTFALNSNAANDSSVDGDYSPTIATDRKGVWIATWIAFIKSVSFLVYSRSIDGCATWSTVKPITTAVRMYGINVPSLSTDSEGLWVVVWLAKDDSIYLSTVLYFSKSIDAGLTWSSAHPFTKNQGRLSSYAQLRAPSSPGGAWVAIWTACYYDQDTCPHVDVMSSRFSTNATCSCSNGFALLADPGVAALSSATCSCEPCDLGYVVPVEACPSTWTWKLETAVIVAIAVSCACFLALCALTWLKREKLKQAWSHRVCSCFTRTTVGAAAEKARRRKDAVEKAEELLAKPEIKAALEKFKSTMPKLAYDVFLSHVQAEGAQYCRALAMALQKQGCQAWYDKEASRLDAIGMLEGVAKSACLLAYVTDSYFCRPWTQFELIAASKLGKPIITLLQEDTRFHGMKFQELVASHSTLADHQVITATEEYYDSMVQKVAE